MGNGFSCVIFAMALLLVTYIASNIDHQVNNDIAQTCEHVNR